MLVIIKKYTIYTHIQTLKEAEVAKKLSLNDELLEKEKQIKHHHREVEQRLKHAQKESERQREDALRLAEESEKLEDRLDEVMITVLAFPKSIHAYDMTTIVS